MMGPYEFDQKYSFVAQLFILRSTSFSGHSS